MIKAISKKFEYIISDRSNYDNGSWYFHGKLEEMFCYDLGILYDLDEEYLRPTLKYNELYDGKTSLNEYRIIKKPHITGIYPVNVYGVYEKCLGFFWIEDKEICEDLVSSRKFPKWTQRGLIVLESDKKSVKHVKRYYNEQNHNL